MCSLYNTDHANLPMAPVRVLLHFDDWMRGIFYRLCRCHNSYYDVEFHGQLVCAWIVSETIKIAWSKKADKKSRKGHCLMANQVSCPVLHALCMYLGEPEFREKTSAPITQKLFAGANPSSRKQILFHASRFGGISPHAQKAWHLPFHSWQSNGMHMLRYRAD